MIWALVASAFLRPHGWAHRRSAGFGFDLEGEPGSHAYGVVMAVLIVGMILSLLGMLFYFRWRAAHPLPEPDSVASVLGENASARSREDTEPKSNREDPSWERPGEWWKGEEAGDSDDRE